MTSRKLGNGKNSEVTCEECDTKMVVNFPPSIKGIISAFPCPKCGAYLIIMAAGRGYKNYSAKQKDDGLEPIPAGHFLYCQGGRRLFSKSSII